jgi:hypothetical protein
VGRTIVLAVLSGFAVLGMGALGLRLVRQWLPGPRNAAIYGRIPADLRALSEACEEFAMEHDGVYPTSLDELMAPAPNGKTGLRGPCLPRDPWGRGYLYEAPCPGEGEPLIWNWGRDGQPGGEREDADFGDWMLPR